ncbi:MAG: T9SS type A sorting domain-containing protein, partial [Ignavibacteria bacterium]
PVWITAIEQVSTEIPKEFKLFQNYPNPFNPNTKIKFQLLKQGIAEIIIYDITGRRIQKLLNEELNAGEYEINFNADGLSSGTYFYKLIINSGKEVFTETKRMVLIK